MFKFLTRRENMHTLTVQRNVYKETESEYMYIMSYIALHCDTLKENFQIGCYMYYFISSVVS